MGVNRKCIVENKGDFTKCWSKVEEEKSVQGDIASDETEEPISEDELVAWTKCIAENKGNYTKCQAKVEEEMLVQDDVASSETKKPMSEDELQVWTKCIAENKGNITKCWSKVEEFQSCLESSPPIPKEALAPLMIGSLLTDVCKKLFIQFKSSLQLNLVLVGLGRAQNLVPNQINIK